MTWRVLALTSLAFLLVACVPPDEDRDREAAAPAAERAAPRHPAAPARKPRAVPKPPKESLQAGEYYRYVDETGRVRMASSLDEVPERQRSTAGRVTAPKPAPQPARRERARVSDEVETLEPSPGAQVVLYTKRSCPWCEKATKYLDSIGQDYVSWDVDQDPEKQMELLQLTNGRAGVPVIVVGNRWMQGWNQEQFDEMLRNATQ